MRTIKTLASIVGLLPWRNSDTDGRLTPQMTRGVCVIAGAIALSAIPSTARAHAGNNDPTLLHVCIGNNSKIVRNVGVTGSCVAGPSSVAETADHWSKLAVPGLPGAKGDKGDKGDTGEKGDSGTNGIDGKDGANATRAAGPCFGYNLRYVNCRNGTVTDTVTGLIWLTDAACLGLGDWPVANEAAATLANGQCGLTDGSSPGDWRLPTKDEWSATIARAATLGCTSSGSGGPPSLTNDWGTACYGTFESSFGGVASEVSARYWSSTTSDFDPTVAWYASLSLGGVSANNHAADLRVWPVRGGSR